MTNEQIEETLSSFWRNRRSNDRAIELRDLQESLSFMARLILDDRQVTLAWNSETLNIEANPDTRWGKIINLDSSPVADIPQGQPVPDERVDVLMGDVLYKSHLEKVNRYGTGAGIENIWNGSFRDERGYIDPKLGAWQPEQNLGHYESRPGRQARSRPTQVYIQEPNPLAEIEPEVAKKVSVHQVTSILRHLRAYHLANVAPPAVGEYVTKSRDWKRERLAPLINALADRCCQDYVSMKDALDFWALFNMYGLQLPADINENLVAAMLDATPKAWELAAKESVSDMEIRRIVTDVVHAFKHFAADPPPPPMPASEPSDEEEDDEDDQERTDSASSAGPDGVSEEPEESPDDEEEPPESGDVPASGRGDPDTGDQDPEDSSPDSEDDDLDWEDDEDDLDDEGSDESGDSDDDGESSDSPAMAPSKAKPPGKSDKKPSPPKDPVLATAEATSEVLDVLNALDDMQVLGDKDTAAVKDAIEFSKEDLTDEMREAGALGAHGGNTIVWQKAKYDFARERELQEIGYKSATGITQLLRQFNQMRSRYEHGLPDGSSLDKRRLGRVLYGNMNIHRNRTIIDKLDMAMVLLMDCSGSIGKDQWDMICEAGAAFMMATGNREDVETIALAYDSGSNSCNLYRIYDRAMGRIHAGRVSGGGTPSALAIATVREVVLKRLGRQRKDRIIIHLTDGAPNNQQTLKLELDKNREAGIETYCILIQTYGHVDDQTWIDQYGVGKFVSLRNYDQLIPCLVELFGDITLRR